jgi:hypothetical protein
MSGSRHSCPICDERLLIGLDIGAKWAHEYRTEMPVHCQAELSDKRDELQ